MHARTQLRVLVVTLGLATPLVGCQQVQRSIDGLTVPKDFTFANTRSVSVQIGASAATLGAGGWAGLEIARPDGKLLYRGPLGASHPVQVHLAVASKDDSLQATLTTADGGRHLAQVHVAGNSATHTF